MDDRVRQAASRAGVASPGTRGPGRLPPRPLGRVARRPPTLRNALWAAAAALLVAAAATTHGGTRWPAVYYMTGPSMEPTLSPRELFLVWTPPGRIQRGDLVLFRFIDEGSEHQVLRRVVGLPGDTIAMEQGRVIVNSRPQQWPYRIEIGRAHV